ncbi:MAG: flippase-like domain-containing protein [Armatimonadetes bacterium]|nr:flippase-like domain-containing protein [Armatimonadota bacterium]MDW8122791.1 lysylphosphatidylglycerol synthase transmembrane domain-containing protein [Armatimonadota bacterium]
MEKKGHLLLTAVRIALTGIFLYLAVRSVSFADLQRGLTGKTAFAVVGASVVYFFLQSLSATRWWLLARASSFPLAWTDAVVAFYSGMFFNLFLPGLVGGDAVRAYLAGRRADRSVATSLGIVYADRTLGLMVLILVGLWSAAAVHLQGRFLVWGPLVVGAVALLLMTVLLVLITGFLSKVVKGPWGERFGRFGSAITLFLQKPSALLAVLPIAFLYHLSLIVILQAMALPLGIREPSFAAFALIVSAATVVGALPITLHGLGLREWAVVQISPLLGFPVEAALLWALLWRLVSWLICLPGGLVYLFWAEKTVKEDLVLLIQRARRASPSPEKSIP